MDEAKLQEIEARANAATPGPWYAGNGHPYVTTERMGFGIVVARALEGNDCTFIAHVRTDVPDLLAEVRRLTAEVATARREGAEEMRSRCAAEVSERMRSALREAKGFHADDLGRDCNEAAGYALEEAADAIRALPLDAPGGES